MSWVKLDDRFLSHPKVIDLSKDAKLLYIAGLSHCASQLTDGFLSHGAVRTARGLVDASESSIQELLDANLWDSAEKGYSVHDYLKYNPTAEETIRKREEIAKLRSAAGKKGMSSRWGNNNKITNSVTTAVTHSGLQTAYQNDNPVPVPVPVFVPDPDPEEIPTINDKSVNGLESPLKRIRKSTQPNETDILERATARLTWESYSIAYCERYGIEPIRNLKISSQVLQFVKRVPKEEAPSIAGWYVLHEQQYYVSSGHPIGLLLRDAEKLRTEWITGRMGTVKGSRERDRLQERGQMWQRLIEEAEREERAL